MIFHLAVAADWEAAGDEYRMSTVGRTLDDEGFVHCSYAGQVEATAARFYAGRDDVLLLTIDPTGLDVREEGGFPHVYGPLPRAAVTAVRPYP